jgi:hypothetical protein
MKTTTTAAILLLSGAIFFSQASLAGKPDKGDKPPKPDPVDCVDFPVTYSVCTDKLAYAHMTLGTYEGDFKNAKDFIGLRCKVVNSEIKMSEDKPADALLKLEASFEKVWTLVSQRKLKKTAAYMIADDIAAARDCAEAQIPTTP